MTERKICKNAIVLLLILIWPKDRFTGRAEKAFIAKVMVLYFAVAICSTKGDDEKR